MSVRLICTFPPSDSWTRAASAQVCYSSACGSTPVGVKPLDAEGDEMPDLRKYHEMLAAGASNLEVLSAARFDGMSDIVVLIEVCRMHPVDAKTLVLAQRGETLQQHEERIFEALKQFEREGGFEDDTPRSR